MLGFNWIDVIIVGLLIGAVYEGSRIGFVEQIGVIVGFFLALFAGGWLFPHILPVHDRTLATIVNGSLVLALAGYVAGRGLSLGRRWHASLKISHTIHWLEASLGMVLSAGAVLIAVWLLSVMISRLPFAGFSNSTSDALIVQALDALSLPPVPAVFAEFDRLVNPNQSPYIFVATPHLSSVAVNDSTSLRLAATRASTSTARITSFSCGAIVAGSGFVVANNLVATNAHVIAGAKRPIIKYKNHSYTAVPVLFNPSLDFALLRVKAFPAPPLDLLSVDVKTNTNVIISGYPDGSYAVVPGLIRLNETLFGRNIYDEGVFGRDIYVVQTKLDPGSSGGPMLLSNGQVAGIVFGRPADNPNYGYAISSSTITAQVQRAKTATSRVSTGTCLAS